mmetsp:Transcript_43510/g.94741  ORF Transcript_43510/g.94741 Transcript_43510/m.94741 type:complete len:211 (+) Transcript_43510:554-1186(+)
MGIAGSRPCTRHLWKSIRVSTASPRPPCTDASTIPRRTKRQRVSRPFRSLRSASLRRSCRRCRWARNKISALAAAGGLCVCDVFDLPEQASRTAAKSCSSEGFTMHAAVSAVLSNTSQIAVASMESFRLCSRTSMVSRCKPFAQTSLFPMQHSRESGTPTMKMMTKDTRKRPWCSLLTEGKAMLISTLTGPSGFPYRAKFLLDTGSVRAS